MRVTDYLLVIPDLVFDDGDRRPLGAEPVPRDHRDRHPGVDLHRPDHPRPGDELRERVYVKRARALGAGHARIIIRHILPQVGPLLMANTVLTIAIAIYLETALAFLGLEDPTVITWGTILEHAFERTAISSGAWWAIVPAGFVIAPSSSAASCSARPSRTR